MKMKQPELGRKIAELRKAKGYTQEELVDMCNLSVRTLQRIESGEVIPRSHTIRVIFAALDYKVYDSSGIRLRLFIKQVSEVFNLKTNTMKKLSILSMVFAAAAIVLLSVCINGNAQSEKKVRKIIEANNEIFTSSFNSGDLDALMALYRDDACLVGDGCGKAFIRGHYATQMRFFKFEDIQLTGLSVADSIAVEVGRWSGTINSGPTLSGEYMTEWRRRDKTWQIVNDLATND